MFSTDVDECALGNHGCAETCENFGGGFFCSCQAGLRLAANGKDCEGMELCSFMMSHKKRGKNFSLYDVPLKEGKKLLSESLKWKTVYRLEILVILQMKK